MGVLDVGRNRVRRLALKQGFTQKGLCMNVEPHQSNAVTVVPSIGKHVLLHRHCESKRHQNLMLKIHCCAVGWRVT